MHKLWLGPWNRSRMSEFWVASGEVVRVSALKMRWDKKLTKEYRVSSSTFNQSPHAIALSAVCLLSLSSFFNYYFSYSLQWQWIIHTAAFQISRFLKPSTERKAQHKPKNFPHSSTPLTQISTLPKRRLVSFPPFDMPQTSYL